MLRSRGTTEPGAASLEVTKMRRRHLRGVMAIERQAYSRPWTPNLFMAEMSEPNNRNYLVARIDKDVVGYAGLICYGDEAHITNIAVDPMLQGHGIAHRLLAEEIGAARELGGVAVSLEVRVTNWRAQRIYARFGFHPVGHPPQLLRGAARGRADHVDRRHPRARVPSADRLDRQQAARGDPPRLITLGIETSCDETAVAIVEDGFTVRANLIARQEHLHERFGGVVPEVAARAHVEALNPLLGQALEATGLDFGDLGGVAVTVGPGLVGALLVGMAAAKSVALATGAPLIGVNHLEAHYWANFLEHGAPDPPYVALIVSGGHTMLVHVPAMFRHEILGQTLDDAAGEAFDKVARLLGLGFPGGPALDAAAQTGDPRAVRFPRAMEDSGDLDFSMSGLKTAVLRHVQAERAAGRSIDVPDLAASFQEAIVDVQVTKTLEAARRTGVARVLLGGGVVANTRLRERLQGDGTAAGLEVLVPPLALCTDNAAMVACLGAARLERGERTGLDIAADPNLPLAT